MKRALVLYQTQQWVRLRACLSRMEQKNPNNSAKNPSKEGRILHQCWPTVDFHVNKNRNQLHSVSYWPI
jgi:hypothetical protein